MPTLTEQRESQNGWHQPPAKPLDEAVWQAWLVKGRRKDARSTHTRLEVVKMVSIVALMAAVALWPDIARYQTVFEFGVAMAAMFVMFHAFHSRRYLLGAVFGALVLLYLPVTPLFHGPDDLQRLLMAISTGPFIVSLGWREASRSKPGATGAVEHGGLRA